MWLSLVEHLVRDEGVGGSNPLIPTTNDKGFGVFRDLFYFVALPTFAGKEKK